MNKRIAVSVFLATLLYQFIDAGAELLLPFYDRGGIVALLLFWLIPGGTAFILGYRETWQQAMDNQRRKQVYFSTVFGAVAGQFLGLVVLLPTPALPDMTLIGAIILAGITGMFVLIAVGTGVMLVYAANGNDEFLTYRQSLICSVPVLLIGFTYLFIKLSNLSSPYISGNDAVLFTLAGIWLLIYTRTLKQNSDDGDGGNPSTA
ncbi:MAG: hypothetical protein ACQERM_07570 [Methanobacteriota archaeon]